MQVFYFSVCLAFRMHYLLCIDACASRSRTLVSSLYLAHILRACVQSQQILFISAHFQFQRKIVEFLIVSGHRKR